MQSIELKRFVNQMIEQSRRNMQGTFEYCSKCKEKINCCVDFCDIDNPIIHQKEKETIQQRTNCSDEIFSKIDGECYNINTKDGVCPFYKNGCTIYDIRPNDCRLYPYDLKQIDGKMFLIRYKANCLKGCVVDDYIDDVVERIKPYISTYTDKRYEQKVNLFDYEIIKEIEL